MPLNPFCKLSPYWHYLPCQWNFRHDAEARQYFVAFFREQFDRTLTLAGQVALGGEGTFTRDHDRQGLQATQDQCREEFNRLLDEVDAHPEHFDRPTILSIDYIRDAILRQAGFVDPYFDVKHHDNDRVIELLPDVCRDIDAHAEPLRLASAIRGAMAGNIFDMGVAATAARMMEKTLSFLHTRDNLPPRPWLVDDFDILTHRLLRGPIHHKAVLFVDNAGADFVLGMLPLARYLAMRGTQVVIVGNELPTLNDMTIHDIRQLWPSLVAAEPSLANLPIELASSGTGEPLIDLSAVSRELNQLSANADLVVLEGMGRALESNFFARFDCDVLKIAMIKDDFVARSFGGKLYDVVCRFELVGR